MPIGVCHTRCFDNQSTRHYYPGDQDELSLDHQLAQHFTFFATVPPPPAEKPAERPTMEDIDPLADAAVKAAHEGRPLPVGAQRAIDAAARQKASK